MKRENVPGGSLALFAQGFRPFFLAASLWAASAMAIWIVMLETGLSLPSRLDPLAWHMHEMLFGFVMAAVAGFLLTAIPNWTGRLPISGAPLAGLAGLWLLGRIACLTSVMMPAWLAIACDLAFPVALAAVVAREIIAGKNWRNLLMLAPVTFLGAANLLMHLEASGIGIPAGLGWRLGLVAIVFLVTVIGGRIVPSFTRNWLVKQAAKSLPAPSGWPDRAALFFLHAGLFGWAAFPRSSLVAILILVGAGLNLWRLYRWRGLATGREPLLVILHIGYAWVIAGAALLGLSLLTNRVPESAAIHALTVGAIGTMILAVMTRATRGHTGRPLTADRLTSLIYVQVGLAAIARVAATFPSDWTTQLLPAAAVLWSTAFITFVFAYGPMLILPRRGPPS